jgi:hydroxymethylglutaryl-CoA synthase
MIGIVSYGVYIPEFRIKVDEIARMWGKSPDDIKKSLGVYEKSVPDFDEDTATIAVEASRNALRGVDGKRIGAVYVGSESHPYAVKPTATIVAEAIGATSELTAADFEFACKAGTSAIQTCMGLVNSGLIDLGLAVGADVAQSAPGDPLEYTASAGGAAFVVGKDPSVEIEATHSYTTDTPDFWRREGEPYPSHGGRFTGAPAYFKHVINSSLGLMKKISAKPEDFTYAVFHQPNGKFPRRVAKELGFKREQIEEGMVVGKIGNTYSASSLIGLAAILDVANPGDRILLTSFGSGAGSDSFSLKVLKESGKGKKVGDFMKGIRYLSYAEYAKHVGIV